MTFKLEFNFQETEPCEKPSKGFADTQTLPGFSIPESLRKIIPWDPENRTLWETGEGNLLGANESKDAAHGTPQARWTVQNITENGESGKPRGLPPGQQTGSYNSGKRLLMDWGYKQEIKQTAR